MLAELERREEESAAYIRPQRQNADLVVRFAPIEGRDDPAGTSLSASLMMRPTIDHPDLNDVLQSGLSRAMHLELERDPDGRPVETLHVHGYVPREESLGVEKAIWSALGAPDTETPECLGRLGDARSEPLAIAQLLLLYHLTDAAR